MENLESLQEYDEVWERKPKKKRDPDEFYEEKREKELDNDRSNP